MNEKLPIWAEWLFSTPSWVPALCAVGLTAWLIWLSRDRQSPVLSAERDLASPPTLAGAPLTVPAVQEGQLQKQVSDFASGLYVGEINVDTSKLAHEFYFTMYVGGFNATSELVSLDTVRGYARLREVIGSSLSAGEDVPPTSLNRHPARPSDIANFGSFVVVLDQRLPRELAERVAGLIAEGQTVQFDLRALDVLARVAQDSSKTARLPLWDGITLAKRPEAVIARRVTNVTLGSAAVGVR